MTALTTRVRARRGRPPRRDRDRLARCGQPPSVSGSSPCSSCTATIASRTRPATRRRAAAAAAAARAASRTRVGQIAAGAGRRCRGPRPRGPLGPAATPWRESVPTTMPGDEDGDDHAVGDERRVPRRSARGRRQPPGFPAAATATTASGPGSVAGSPRATGRRRSRRGARRCRCSRPTANPKARLMHDQEPELARSARGSRGRPDGGAGSPRSSTPKSPKIAPDAPTAGPSPPKTKLADRPGGGAGQVEDQERPATRTSARRSARRGTARTC